MWPAGCRCAMTGSAVSLGSLPRLDRLAGHQRRRRVPRRAGDRRVRRALDPHPQGAVLVGGAARHHRPATPSRQQLRRPLQQLVADPATRPPDSQGGVSGSSSGSSGMINLAQQSVQETGRWSVHVPRVATSMDTGWSLRPHRGHGNSCDAAGAVRYRDCRRPRAGSRTMSRVVFRRNWTCRGCFGEAPGSTAVCNLAL